MPPAVNFSEEDAQAAWVKLQTQVMPHMQVTEPDCAEEPETAYHRGSLREREILIQYLTDLGYLPGDVSEFPNPMVRAAIASWRADTKELPAVYLRANTLLTCREFLEAGEMARLAAHVGFENELQLKRMPEDGEHSLLSRIVRFRMKSFNLNDCIIAAPFDALSRQQLRDLGNLLKIRGKNNFSAELNLVHQLGNAALLSRTLMKGWGEWVYVFRHDPASLDDSVASKLVTFVETNNQFKQFYKPTNKVYQRLFISTGKHRELDASAAKGAKTQNMYGEDGFNYYRSDKPKKWIRQEIEARPGVEDAAKHMINRLGLELLQLRLWLLGYYRGEIDGKWGPLSFAALQQFLTDEGAETDKLVFHLSDNYIALNLRYLFKRILPEIDESTDSVELRDVQALEEEVFAQLQEPQEWEEVQHSYNEMERAEQTLFLDSSRRRYSGLRGFFAAIGRFLKRVARSIVKAAKAVLEGVKKLLSSALHIFRRIIHGIRKGLRVVGLAVKRFYYWLFKKPFITGADDQAQFVVTRFDWDGDIFQYVNEGTSEQRIRQHNRFIRRMNLAFAIVGRLAVEAINLIVSAATYNWLRLAWSLIRLLTAKFWREIKTIIRDYRETFAGNEIEMLSPITPD